MATLALLAGGAASPPPASANGAFPDSQALWWETGGAGLVLATNFGLVRSDDGGQSWTWTCELGLAAGGSLYAETTSRRLFTLGNEGLAASDDRGCTWQTGAATTLASQASDYFLDPSDPRRLWLISDGLDGDGGAAPRGARGLYLSRDGGETYDLMATFPSQDGVFTGVETRWDDSSFVAATVQRPAPMASSLGVSRDGGASFHWEQLEGLAPLASLRLLGIDRTIRGRIYLRATFAGEGASRATDDGLVVVTAPEADEVSDASATSDMSAGSGAPLTTAVPVRIAGGTMTAFLQRENGDVLVAGQSPPGPWSFRATTGDTSFAPWETGGLHVKALTEHAGVLYVAADQLGSADPFAVGESDDDGAHWRPLLASFRQVDEVPACAAAACREACASYVAFGLFRPALCEADATDGATPPRESARDGATDDGPDRADAGPLPGARTSGGAGCACAATGAPVPLEVVGSVGVVVGGCGGGWSRAVRPRRPRRSRSVRDELDAADRSAVVPDR